MNAEIFVDEKSDAVKNGRNTNMMNAGVTAGNEPALPFKMKGEP